MSQDNLTIVEQILEGWAAGDFGVTVPNLAPHAVIVVPPSFMESGVYVGADGIAEYTRRFMEQYERARIEASRFRRAGDTVMAEVIQCGKGRSSGIEIRMPYFMLFTFRAGRVVRIESVMEKTNALEAAGLAGEQS